MELQNINNTAGRIFAGLSSVLAPTRYDTAYGSYFETARPMIDGNEFKADPMKLFKSGQWPTNKEIIFGHNNGESDIFYLASTNVDKNMFEVCMYKIYKS